MRIGYSYLSVFIAVYVLQSLYYWSPGINVIPVLKICWTPHDSLESLQIDCSEGIISEFALSAIEANLHMNSILLQSLLCNTTCRHHFTCGCVGKTGNNLGLFESADDLQLFLTGNRKTLFGIDWIICHPLYIVIYVNNSPNSRSVSIWKLKLTNCRIPRPGDPKANYDHSWRVFFSFQNWHVVATTNTFPPTKLFFSSASLFLASFPRQWRCRWV